MQSVKKNLVSEKKILAYEGIEDNSLYDPNEPLNPFLTASKIAQTSKLAIYLIPKESVTNYTNTITTNSTFYDNKQLFKAKRRRTNFGFAVLHDGGDIPWCVKHSPDNIEECVVRNIISFWKTKTISSHYYIGCDGTIFKLVPEEYIAAHAGCKSSDCTLKGINNISIGIDLRNCSRYETKEPYTTKQYIALNSLLQDLEKRGLVSEIKDETVIGHFEILGYKNDPLPGFKWLTILGIIVDHRTLRTSGKKTPFQIAASTVLSELNVA